MNAKDLLKAGVIVVALAYAAYATTYVIHEKYMLPFHSDEWDHLTVGKEITKTGTIESIKRINPYIGVPYTGYWVNLESGFHAFTAILLLATGLEVTAFGVLMPTIVAFILALNAFVFIRYLTKSALAGLISAVYAVTLKSNVTFLGPWFYVPSSLGLAYAPLFLYAFLRAVQAGKTINAFDLSLGLMLAFVGLAHPPSATTLIPVFILYLLVNPRQIARNKKKMLIAAGGCLLALIAALFVMHVPLQELSNPLDFLSRYLVFTGSDYDVRIMYSYPVYLGYGVIFLAVVGAYVAISSNNREEWILPLAVLSLLPLAVQFYHTGRVFLSPYRRIFFYTAEMLLLSAGIGLYYLYREALNLIRKTRLNVKAKFALDALVIAAIAYVLTVQVASTFTNAKKLYHVIEEKDVEPLLWIRENTPEAAVFMVQIQSAQAVTPIAERRIVGKVRTFLRVSQERVDDTNTFFNVGCEKREQIARKYGVSYVFGPRMSCDFLYLIHNSGGDYVYKVELT